MANKLKFGMKVRALPRSEFYGNRISAEGAEGIVIMINRDRAIIELSPESLMKVSTEHYDYCDSHGIKREIAIIRTDELEIVSEANHKSNIRPASAHIGGGGSLVGVGCFLPIALMAGIFAVLGFYNYLFNPNYTPNSFDIWQSLILLLIFAILSAAIFGLVHSSIIDFRLKRSKKVRNAVVIDKDFSQVGTSQYCYVYCLYDNKIIWQKVSYNRFERYKIGRVIKVRLYGNDDKYIKIV